MALMVLLFLLAVKVETDFVLGQSLSRLKAVTMSSQYQDWVGSRVVDGNYNRESSVCNCCAQTSTEGKLVDPWMEIDLAETTEFNRIVVHGQNSGTFPRQNLIGLSIHLDGSQTSIASIGDTSQGYVNFYHFDLGQKYSARRIKLILKGPDKVLLLCEVDVFNDSKISNGKDVTAISTLSNLTPSNAVDGDTRTNADVCLCCAITKHHNDPWINVDLGDVYLITYIQMYGRTDKQVKGQSFEGMNVTVDDVVIQTVPTTGTFISYYEVFPTPEKIGRNVKFTLTGDGRVISMCEIAIHGDHFKRRVISHRKPAQISSLYVDWAASRAVDGDYRTDPEVCYCCTATNYQKNPWLRVDLGFEHRVSRVVIYGRTDGQFRGQNFEGLAITLDSTVAHTIPTSTNWIDFYEYPLATVQLATSVTLTLVGPYEQLVVCEVLVYGDCKKSFFGDSCSTQCHCEGETCPTTSGVCPSGRCKPGYHTDTCSKQCDTGKYGQDCLMQCGNCKDGQICDHVSGHCGECKAGYTLTDPLCKTPCSEARYGYNCTGLCGRCRQDEPCNITNGYCNGCKDGYTYSDPFCKTGCSIGTYGTNCTETCGNCRDGEICGAVNGYCTACRDGYMETDRTCKTHCPSGSYSRNCAMSCGSCSGGLRCNHVDGSCEDCMNGTYVFNDKRCSKACSEGRYGYNCTGVCGSCRRDEPCDIANGYCNECKDGYTYSDPFCKTGCSIGTYGTNCTETCGNCRGGDICDAVNGYCTACRDGYMETDRTCKTRCPTGSYGRNCAMSCGSCSGGVRCNHVDGSCEDCMNGIYVFNDKRCSKSCEPHTYGYNCTGNCGNCRGGVPCNRVNGNCVECEDGYTNNTDSHCNTSCSNGTFGYNCQQTCGICAFEETCDGRTGKCPDGCSNGYLGEACLQRISKDEATGTTISLFVYIGSLIALSLPYWLQC